MCVISCSRPFGDRGEVPPPAIQHPMARPEAGEGEEEEAEEAGEGEAGEGKDGHEGEVGEEGD